VATTFAQYSSGESFLIRGCFESCAAGRCFTGFRPTSSGSGSVRSMSSVRRCVANDVLQFLLDLVARLGAWSYLIIFGAAALECAAFAGLLVPGESLVLASGFLAHHGILHLVPVMVATATGAIVGDNIGYFLGSRLGREWLLRRGSRFGIRKRGLARVERFFQRQGAEAVFFGRFVGFARALVPFVAGASNMPYRKFVLYDALGAVLWTIGFVTLGYVLGASWQVAEKWIGRSGLIIATLVALVALVIWLRRRRKKDLPQA
jgi:membrane protein DedA with SNARE-associated domain